MAFIDSEVCACNVIAEQSQMAKKIIFFISIKDMLILMLAKNSKWLIYSRESSKFTALNYYILYPLFHSLRG